MRDKEIAKHDVTRAKMHLPVDLARLRVGQSQEQLLAFNRAFQRIGLLILPVQRLGLIHLRIGLGVQVGRIEGAGGQQLAVKFLCLTEDRLAALAGGPSQIAGFLRQAENEVPRGFGRRCQGLLGAIGARLGVA